MNDLKIIEHKDNRVLLTTQLAENFQTGSNNIKNNFLNHKERFEEGKHYFILHGNELKGFKNQVNDIDLVPKHTSTLYLWTEKGALRHAKILDTNKAWEVYEMLEDTYFRAKQQALETQNLSPQLQLLINMELEQKQIKQELQNMRDVITLDPNSWREDCRKLIVKIAQKHGGNTYIRDTNKEIYSLLNKRFGVDLTTRLTNKRRRMAEEGVCKSKRDKLSYVDIISEDKKLIEGYVAIVKEMSIKYAVA